MAPSPITVTLELTGEQLDLLAHPGRRDRRGTHAADHTVCLHLPLRARASELLRASRQRIYDLLSNGRLTRHKDGSRVLIRRDEVDRYLRGEAVGPVAEAVRGRNGRTVGRALTPR